MPEPNSAAEAASAAGEANHSALEGAQHAEAPPQTAPPQEGASKAGPWGQGSEVASIGAVKDAVPGPGEAAALQTSATVQGAPRPAPEPSPSLHSPLGLVDATLALEQEQQATAQLMQPPAAAPASQPPSLSVAAVCGTSEPDGPPPAGLGAAQEEGPGVLGEGAASGADALAEVRQRLLTHVEMLEAQVEAMEASNREMQSRCGPGGPGGPGRAV